MRVDRLLNFIPDEQYENLPKKTLKSLLDYRKLYYNISRKEKKIKRMVQELKDERELLRDMKQDLTSKNHFIDLLRKNFYFTCSVVSFKKGGHVYYNVTISRKGESKNMSLGREETIREHLFNYYKDKSFLHKTKDWKTFLKIEMNTGETYKKILDMIVSKSISQWKETTLNRHTFFPLNSDI